MSEPVMDTIVAADVLWVTVTVLLWLLGVPSGLVALLLGIPVGWTIGIFIVAAFYSWKHR